MDKANHNVTFLFSGNDLVHQVRVEMFLSYPDWCKLESSEVYQELFPLQRGNEKQ